MAAKRSKKSSAQGGGIGVAVIGIGYSIYSFIVDHKDTAILVAAAVVGLIILLVVAKRIRIARYWAWYYSRDRGLADISAPEYLIDDATSAALNRTSQTVLGCCNEDYLYLKDSIESAYHSDEVVYIEDQTVTDKYASDGYSGTTLLNSINVSTDGEPISIFCKVNEDGGYHFIILPNIVYAFITGGRRYTFVGAYDQKMFKMELDHTNYRKEYHHITDMSHQPRSYFLRYCDVKDSKAVAAGWQYETKNGYRDGRRQGNNFFIVKFSYTKISYSWGQLRVVTACSNTAVYALLWDAYKAYKEMDRSRAALDSMAEYDTETAIDESDDDDYEDYDDYDDENGITDEEEPTVDEASEGAISCDEARSRNREFTKEIKDTLNLAYSFNPEFKVFQVRKERDDWKLQDSEVYTYIEKYGSKVCLEYILRTTLEDGKTRIEYKLSADDEKVLQEHFQHIIKKHSMQSCNSAYCGVLIADYHYWNNDDMKQRLVCFLRDTTNEVINLT